MKSPTSSTLCLTLWIASLGMASVDTHQFLIKSDARGVTSLRRAADSSLEFIAPDHRLGQVILRYRSGGHTDWVTVDSTAGAMDQLTVEGDYRQARDVDAIRLTQSWTEEAGVLRWHVSVTNTRDTWIEIGDVELPLPMFTQYGKFERHEDRVINLTKRLFRHAHISGHGSFVYWMPVCGVGSHLVLTPVNGTSLEYFEDSGASYAHGGVQYRVYAHSAATGPTRPGTWRQAHTSRRLEPTETASYTFEFRWADDLAGVRDALVSSGGFDIHVVPGMVVPTDLDARFAVRTHNRVVQVVPEFPKSTTIEELTSPDQDTRIWRVAFARLGENRLTIHTVDGKRAYLEFFSTVPIESLIKRRAAFIHERQQHRDSATWYDGLFSLYDTTMEQGRCRLGPDNPGGQHPYAVSGSDDPSNSKCIYLSEKNVVWPEASEIASLEYFIEHFVWGKHQRTDKETPYPYGIYGSDSWLVNRNADRDPIEQGISRPGGPSACRMWRSFDYTTYFAMYYNMYRIATQNPNLVHTLTADAYLMRAYGTARAYFEVPYNIRMEGGWSFTGWTDWAYTLGNFHEKYLLRLIEALKTEGYQAEADYLRSQWEIKVKYFLWDDPYPYISEMPVDSTAYESTYAITRYAIEHGLKPDKNLWQNKNTGTWYSHPVIDPSRYRTFLNQQLLANLGCRGWLETSYMQLGSDFRGCGSSFYTLSYMSQMGGWSILDQAFRFEDKPALLLRLGYASMLSSWALMSQDPAHDGAVGWGFTPQKFGRGWNPRVSNGWARGPWPVCGEIDHGLTAYVETAATVVIDDPLFGRIAYGGTVRDAHTQLAVTPSDGVRQRLWVIEGDRRIEMNLMGNGFADQSEIVLKKDVSKISFTLDDRMSTPFTTLRISGLAKGTYRLAAGSNDLALRTVAAEGDAIEWKIPAPTSAERAPRIDIRRDSL